MDRTSTHPVDQSAPQPALDPRKVNLRPLLWRSRAAFSFLFLTAGITFVVLMTFGSGSTAPPDPAVVQARAEAHLASKVAAVLEATRPADQPLALPASKHSKGGLLLPLRSSVVDH